MIVCVGVAVKPTLQPLWVAHNIMLLTRGRILVQQSKPNWPVVHHGGRHSRLAQFQRSQLIDNDGGLVIHSSYSSGCRI
jgi:hypothetical protein